MSNRQPLVVLAIHGGIALVVVLCVTALAWHGSLDAEAATALFGTAVGLAGGSASSIGALAQAVNGKATVSDATLRQAMRSPAAPLEQPAAPVEPPE